ncbi:hypothetical protein KFU94_56695 [Chloroflexi bacterium TSY]|nr:hypothetical protein [Chloroflexi bacterium TSY]
MLTDFTAKANIHGHRIDLSWSWTGGEERPKMRLLRRRYAYPTRSNDGFCIFDTDTFFGQSVQSWGRVERTFYLDSSVNVESNLSLVPYFCATRA